MKRTIKVLTEISWYFEAFKYTFTYTILAYWAFLIFAK